MTILDSIRFPVYSIHDARRVWPILPMEIKDAYRAWWNTFRPGRRPTEAQRNEYLRKLIREHE